MESTGKATEPPQPPPQEVASPALISAVLGNDDILREILVRLDFPTCLVRAAAVSKRWLRHASDPAFLSRFRRLHPPRLLGFYLDLEDSDHQQQVRFISLPQPPELAAVIRRGKFDLGRDARYVMDCCNGRLVVKIAPDDRPSPTIVWRPLHPQRGAMVLPLPPKPSAGHDVLIIFRYHHFLFHGDGDDTDISLAAGIMRHSWQAKVQLQDFKAGDWGEARNSDLIQLPAQLAMCDCKPSALLAHGKIYLICMAQYILGLDVQSMSLFSIKLPNGVEFEYEASIGLSRAEGSGFCLVHVRKFQISVWRYTMDHNRTGNWELIDTISLRQVFGSNVDPTWCSQDTDVRVAAVGDNADFVFLTIEEKVFYLHISSRTVEKVYELAEDEDLFGVSPFMMVWPPTFPKLNGGHDNDE